MEDKRWLTIARLLSGKVNVETIYAPDSIGAANKVNKKYHSAKFISVVDFDKVDRYSVTSEVYREP